MKSFMCENFLLTSDFAQILYHEYAKEMPIFDYHCHLSPQQLAENTSFDNLSQISLAGDHYKWRAMRTAGINEQLITGNASDREKFDAWSGFLPQAIGNPLYHWAHMELKNPFDIQDTVLDTKTADSIWETTSSLLSSTEFSAQGILQKMHVDFVGTTDDPCDTLEHHASLAKQKASGILSTTVSPSWRPDRAFKIDDQHFCQYLEKLTSVTDQNISCFTDFLDALLLRLEHFDKHGCRSADHGIEHVRYAKIPNDATLDRIIAKRIGGVSLSELEVDQFSTAVQVWLAAQYHKRGWAMQLHIGAQRNNNTRMFKRLGRDAGFDSIGEQNFAQPLAHLLDAMDMEERLPKTILYSLNPRANEMLATMAGNFQDGITPGKIQFGSAWWFNDQKDGMNRQLEQLSQLGLLSQFIGMLTDSRSLLSFSRHEYFRRILCEKVGSWVINGEAPADEKLLGNIIQDVCFNNAKTYFSAEPKA